MSYNIEPMKEVDLSGLRQESIQSKEILVPKFGGATISGPSGTGKTAVMEIISDLYSISPDRRFKTGKIIRDITKTGNTIRGFMDRDESVDQEIDEVQRGIIRNADTKNPFILEGRLAGVLATEELTSNPELNIVRMLFTAPSEIRMKRILKRALHDKAETVTSLEKEYEKALEQHADPGAIEYLTKRLLDEGSEVLTLDTIKQKEKEREIKDLKRWRKTHENLRGVSPFNPANKDNKGGHIYNLIVHTGHLSVEQVVNQVTEELINQGLLEKRVEEEKFPKSAIIFQA
jgi:cytidylate kinase